MDTQGRSFAQTIFHLHSQALQVCRSPNAPALEPIRSPAFPQQSPAHTGRRAALWLTICARLLHTQEAAEAKTFEPKQVTAVLNSFTSAVREEVLKLFQVRIAPQSHTLQSTCCLLLMLHRKHKRSVQKTPMCTSLCTLARAF